MRPATPPLVITVVVDIVLLIPVTITRVIVEDMLVELDTSHKRQAPLPIGIREQELMLKEQMNVGLRTSIITTINKVTVVDCWLHQYLHVV